MEITKSLKKLKEQAETSSFKVLKNIFSTNDQIEQIQQILLKTDSRKVY